MAARVSQAGALAVGPGTPTARVSQAGVLAAGVGTPAARASQAGLAVAWKGSPALRASQAGLLVVVPSFAATATASRAKPRPARVARGSPLAAGLLASWTMADGAGAAVRDAAGARHGTLSGGASWGVGPCGPTLDLDGASGQFAAPSPAAGLAEATFQVRVYQPSAAAGLYGPYLCSDTAYNAGFYLGRDEAGGVQAFVGTAQAFRLSALAEDAWHDLALVFRGGVSLTLYADGVAIASTSSGVPATVPAHANVQAGINSASSLATACRLDAARVYGRALSADELRRLAADPSAPERPPTPWATLMAAALPPPAFVPAGGVGWASGSPFTYLTG